MISDELAGRVRDVALTLAAIRTHDESLGRIQLQKLVYLIDVFVCATQTDIAPSGYVTYLYGPYDRRVQDAVDVLAFRGLASMHIVDQSPGRTACRYTATDAGIRWVETLCGQSPSIGHRGQLADELVSSLCSRHALPRLRELVYSEPGFRLAKARGFMKDIVLNDVDSNPSAQLIRLVRRALSGQGYRLSRGFIADVFIELLTNESDLHHVLPAGLGSEHDAIGS